LLRNKFLENKDSEKYKILTKNWCEKNKISIEKFSSLKNIKIINIQEKFLNTDDYNKIRLMINKSDTKFGGAGHLNLIYSLCEKLNICNAVETGVAYGWSSLAILLSISKRKGSLVSTDMEVIKQKNYGMIGIAVNKKYHNNWHIVKQPDIYGLNTSIKKLNYNYDFVHYDSDKSYYGRRWSYPILYKYLNTGGVFVSDDIQDNEYFKEFVETNNLEFYVLKLSYKSGYEKFVGVVFK